MPHPSPRAACNPQIRFIGPWRVPRVADRVIDKAIVATRRDGVRRQGRGDVGGVLGKRAGRTFAHRKPVDRAAHSTPATVPCPFRVAVRSLRPFCTQGWCARPAFAAGLPVMRPNARGHAPLRLRIWAGAGLRPLPIALPLHAALHRSCKGLCRVFRGRSRCGWGALHAWLSHAPTGPSDGAGRLARGPCVCGIHCDVAARGPAVLPCRQARRRVSARQNRQSSPRARPVRS